MRDLINSVDPLPAFDASEPLMTDAEMAAADKWAADEYNRLCSLLDFEVKDKSTNEMLLSRPDWQKRRRWAAGFSGKFGVPYLS